MVVYNQEAFVKKAIESVLSQRTSFPYRLIISDDSSSDKSYEVCKEFQLEYPDKIILLKTEQNIGILSNYLNCFDYCSFRYVAILEGDDYWIDDHKLQKQFDLLESDSSLGLVHTLYKMYFDKSERFEYLNPSVLAKTISFSGLVYNKILSQSFICSVTVVFRYDIIKSIDFTPFLEKKCNTIDLILWLECAFHYKIAVVPDVTTVYRVSSNSISNNTKFVQIEKFSKTKFYIKEIYLNKYNGSQSEINVIRDKHFVFLFFKAIKSRSFKNIYKYGKRITFNGLVSNFSDWASYNVYNPIVIAFIKL
jgi:glycosyltransferase involved in cell wall biosynthesis